MRDPIFTWDEEAGITTCTLSDKRNTFTGVATCCADDFDMKSRRTGEQIAFYRAEIKYYTHLRDTEVKPGLKALLQLYYSMNCSKFYDKKNYESKMLFRQIRQFENDLAAINELLIDRKQRLNEFIKMKDEFYQAVRNKRKAEKE